MNMTAQNFVTVTNSTQLSYNSQPLFLSGANQAWLNYGNDFGESSSSACPLQDFVSEISAAGGNSVRIWLFTEGDSIPSFSSSGLTSPLDPSVVSDLKDYLDHAADENVFVTISLFNGALMRNQAVKDMFSDDEKLQSFVDNALTPLVEALSSYPALLGWEVLNEPEGSVAAGEADADPCFDTTILAGSGAGWAGTGLRMEDILRFTNRIAAAVHRADGKALVTTGAWSEFSATDAVLESGRGFFNFYKDECLVAAGGEEAGVLDFYQIHT